jgi:hypothetical protein
MQRQTTVTTNSNGNYALAVGYLRVEACGPTPSAVPAPQDVAPRHRRRDLNSRHLA